MYNNGCHQVKAHIRRQLAATGSIETYSSSWQYNTAFISATANLLYDNRAQVSDGQYTYPWYKI